MGLEQLPLNTYISMYARMNRSYNERGSRNNYVHSSVPTVCACIIFSLYILKYKIQIKLYVLKLTWVRNVHVLCVRVYYYHPRMMVVLHVQSALY